MQSCMALRVPRSGWHAPTDTPISTEKHESRAGFVTNAANSRLYATRHIDLMPSQGVTFVMVNCTTDQWSSSQRSADPKDCSASYRSSPQYAQNITSLTTDLKDKLGVENI